MQFHGKITMLQTCWKQQYLLLHRFCKIAVN